MSANISTKTLVLADSADHYFSIGMPYVHVVVQFYPSFKFYFPLFLGMVMYDNEFETKEKKI